MWIARGIASAGNAGVASSLEELHGTTARHEVKQFGVNDHMALAVEMTGLTRSFGGVPAVDRLDLQG
jgi:hypothetical protein